MAHLYSGPAVERRTVQEILADLIILAEDQASTEAAMGSEITIRDIVGRIGARYGVSVNSLGYFIDKQRNSLNG